MNTLSDFSLNLSRLLLPFWWILRLQWGSFCAGLWHLLFIQNPRLVSTYNVYYFFPDLLDSWKSWTSRVIIILIMYLSFKGLHLSNLQSISNAFSENSEFSSLAKVNPVVVFYLWHKLLKSVSTVCGHCIKN